MGDGVRHQKTSCHASIRTKVSGGFGDRALGTPPQQKFKLRIILLDSRVPVLPAQNLFPTHNFLQYSN